MLQHSASKPIAPGTLLAFLPSVITVFVLQSCGSLLRTPADFLLTFASISFLAMLMLLIAGRWKKHTVAEDEKKTYPLISAFLLLLVVSLDTGSILNIRNGAAILLPVLLTVPPLWVRLLRQPGVEQHTIYRSIAAGAGAGLLLYYICPPGATKMVMQSLAVIQMVFCAFYITGKVRPGKWWLLLPAAALIFDLWLCPPEENTGARIVSAVETEMHPGDFLSDLAVLLQLPVKNMSDTVIITTKDSPIFNRSFNRKKSPVLQLLYDPDASPFLPWLIRKNGMAVNVIPDNVPEGTPMVLMDLPAEHYQPQFIGAILKKMSADGFLCICEKNSTPTDRIFAALPSKPVRIAGATRNWLLLPVSEGHKVVTDPVELSARAEKTDDVIAAHSEALKTVLPIFQMKDQDFRQIRIEEPDREIPAWKVFLQKNIVWMLTALAVIYLLIRYFINWKPGHKPSFRIFESGAICGLSVWIAIWTSAVEACPFPDMFALLTGTVFLTACAFRYIRGIYVILLLAATLFLPVWLAGLAGFFCRFAIRKSPPENVDTISLCCLGITGFSTALSASALLLKFLPVFQG